MLAFSVGAVQAQEVVRLGNLKLPTMAPCHISRKSRPSAASRSRSISLPRDSM
jgi:hypothetical protein